MKVRPPPAFLTHLLSSHLDSQLARAVRRIPGARLLDQDQGRQCATGLGPQRQEQTKVGGHSKA